MIGNSNFCVAHLSVDKIKQNSFTLRLTSDEGTEFLSFYGFWKLVWIYFFKYIFLNEKNKLKVIV